MPTHGADRHLAKVGEIADAKAILIAGDEDRAIFRHEVAGTLQQCLDGVTIRDAAQVGGGVESHTADVRG